MEPLTHIQDDKLFQDTEPWYLTDLVDRFVSQKGLWNLLACLVLLTCTSELTKFEHIYDIW